jgi:hypothetical protein
MKINHWARFGLATIMVVYLFCTVGCKPTSKPPYGTQYASDHEGLVDDRQSTWRTRSLHLPTVGWKQYGPPKTPLGTLRKNPSPELRTIGATIDQRNNEVARTLNLTRRGFLDDWDLIWMHKDPSRLSMYPIP